MPPPTPTAGETKPQRLDVGQDGTLLQLMARFVANEPSNHCEFRWWPGLLR